jgi:hypothetical protein
MYWRRHLLLVQENTDNNRKRKFYVLTHLIMYSNVYCLTVLLISATNLDNMTEIRSNNLVNTTMIQII